MSSLTLLVGSIASGKSTYISQNINENVLVINDDAIVNALHGNFYRFYNKKLKPLYKSIENLAISWGLSAGLDVVIDRPNLSPDTRQRYIQLAKSFDCKDIIAVVFPMITPEEAARRRFNSDNRGQNYEYWLRAAQDQLKSYKTVELNEGFSEIVNL